MDTSTFWSIFWSILWFMLLFAWIWLLITIFADIFRDHTLGGWGKALWCLFIIVLPWLGALVYLIARGKSMQERSLAEAKKAESNFQAYVRETASAGSTADELAKLADLRDRGVISAADFEIAKAKVLGGEAAPAMGGNQQPAAATTNAGAGPAS
ncbi:MAG: SHOCT domain-containing protein [Geminicoccaceae bacterium]